MDEFRKWLLESFIKEKFQQIKQMSSIYEKDSVEAIIRKEVEKLLGVVTDFIREFVSIIVRATVIFYLLDIKANETTEVCLHNLLMSLTLKNPVYTKLIELFKTTFKGPMTQLENKIEALQGQRIRVSRMLGVSELNIGE